MDDADASAVYDTDRWATNDDSRGRSSSDGDEKASDAACRVSSYTGYDVWEDDEATSASSTVVASGSLAGEVAPPPVPRALDKEVCALLDEVRCRNWSLDFRTALAMPSSSPAARIAKVSAMYVCPMGHVGA